MMQVMANAFKRPMLSGTWLNLSFQSHELVSELVSYHLFRYFSGMFPQQSTVIAYDGH